MFEKIVLRRSDRGTSLSIGELAEALLFYQNVHLILDYASLNSLVSQIGMPTLLSLLSRPYVSAVYCEEGIGTHTETRGRVNSHSFVAFTHSGSKDVGRLHSRKKRLEFILTRHGYEKRQVRRFVERFRRRVPIRRLSDDRYIEGGVVKAAWNDLDDPRFVKESIRRVLVSILGEKLLPSEFKFDILFKHPSFYINTNIDFEPLNAEIKRRDPTLGEITEASLINNVLMARADTVLAAYYGGEFYTSDLTSEIVRLRYDNLLRRIGIEQQELREFKEIVLQDSPTIREVLNSGGRTFDEFLLLLDKSDKFREWAQKVNPDEKLVKSYFQEVTSEGWINKLPSKMLRYFVGAVVGLCQPVAGLSVSAAESLFVEKIFSGWRPSHFVESKIKPFVSETERAK